MGAELFKKTAFSSIYQKYMIPVSSEVINMISSYVKEKTNGQPLEMLVDVGCGTGRYTLPLAPHFKKVLGIDMSESQINLAKQSTTANNVSYMVASAEKMPVKNDSVDLVHAGLAAHWFTIDKFLNESVRVLKTKGCLALHAAYPATEIEYKDLSRDLTVVMSEVWDTLFQYSDKTTDHMLCQYQNIYEAIPLKDKELITDIPVIVQMPIPDIIGFIQSIYMYQAFMEKDVKGADDLLTQTEKRITDIPVTIQISTPDIIGFIQSVYMYQAFMEKDVKGAEDFLTQTGKRFHEILGEEADSARLNMHMKHYCALACKH